MDEHILAFLQERISAADAARLVAWRSASVENERYFQSMQRVWRSSDRRDPMTAFGDAPSLERLLRGPLHEGSTADTRDGSSPVMSPAIARRQPGDIRRLSMHLLAGALAAAALFVAVLLATRTAPPDALASLGVAEFVTDTAEMATARLDDGSVVRLAPRSRLRVSHAANARESWLDGEAYFAVTHDKARPFRVRTRVGTVEVLGTRFDLRVEADGLRLIVTEGRVALQTASGERREVVAGEMGTVGTDGRINVEAVQEASDLMAWTKGFLVFQDTPLRLVARELESRYPVRVLLPDSTLAERKVTAWFTHQDLPQTLLAICRAVQAHCTLESGIASIEP
ncbi:MAG: FecR domain-containing protein [Gemmatimonadota bacterium]